MVKTQPIIKRINKVRLTHTLIKLIYYLKKPQWEHNRNLLVFRIIKSPKQSISALPIKTINLLKRAAGLIILEKVFRVLRTVQCLKGNDLLAKYQPQKDPQKSKLFKLKTHKQRTR